MKNKNKALLAILAIIIGTIMFLPNWKLIGKTIELTVVETKISYYLPKENKAKQDLFELQHTMETLREQKKELEIKRNNLSKNWK